jgi:hypothetical protein
MEPPMSADNNLPQPKSVGDRGQPPSAGSVEPAQPPLDALLDAQSRDWGRGERRPLEDYLAEQPALAQNAAAVLDLVYHELQLRRRHGEVPTLEEYLRRFPHLAEALPLLFEVAQALQAGRPSTLLVRPDRAVPAGDAPPAGGPAVPGYEILGELGRGGMGVVYRARQARPQRIVGLKVLLAGAHAGQAELVRFKAEAEAAARLLHPHIVQIYEVGEHDGRPFFSMEYCPGGSLADKLAGTPLPARQAAELVQTLAGALQAAHQQGVVHRDLKPANVLLGADGQPKVADFGLAKRLDGALPTTVSGAILGTPSYMAPEQAGGRNKEVGPATDVYALGALLYECLTGRPPFKAATPLETMLQVLADEPERPRVLNPAMDVDLEVICLKCLEKEPVKRYESAAVLADDLERWQKGEPTYARASSALGRAIKWSRRQPTVAGLWGVIIALSLAAVASQLAGSALALLAVIALVWLATLFFFLKRQSQHRDAEERRDPAPRLSGLPLTPPQAARPPEPFAVSPRKRTWSIGFRGRILLGILFGAMTGFTLLPSDDILVPGYAIRLITIAVAGAAVGAVCGGISLAFRGWRLAAGAGLGITSAVWMVRDASNVPWATLGLLPCLALPGLIALFAVLVGALLTRSTGKAEKVPFMVGLLHLVARVVGLLGLLYLPPIFGGELGLLLGGSFGRFVAEPVGVFLGALFGVALAWPPELRPKGWRFWTIVTSERMPVQQRWEFLTLLTVLPVLIVTPYWLSWRDGPPGVLLGSYQHKESLDAITAVALSPDGRLALSGDLSGVVILEPREDTRRRVLEARKGWIGSVAFSPDGSRALSAGQDGTLDLWDVATGKPLRELQAPSGVGCAAFAPDGHTVATGSAWPYAVEVSFRRGRPGAVDPAVRLWDADSGQQLRALGGHGAGVRGVAFGLTGRQVLSASDDGTMRLWDMASGLEVRRIKGYRSRVLGVALSPDGSRALSGHEDGSVRVWDLDNEKEVTRIARHRAAVTAVAFAADGHMAVSGSLDKTVRWWDTTTGRQLGFCWGAKGEFVYSLAVSRDGRAVVAGYEHGAVHLWGWPAPDER